MRDDLGLFDIPLKRVSVITPYLTLGVREDLEEDLGWVPGKVLLLSSKGDIEILTSLYALIVARTSLLSIGKKKGRNDVINVLVAYPFSFEKIKLMRILVDDYLKTNGISDRIDVEWYPVKSSDDLFETVKLFDKKDVYFAPYIELYLTTTKLRRDFMELMLSKVKGKMIILNRFKRTEKTIKDFSDDEVFITATKYPYFDRSLLKVDDAKRGMQMGFVSFSKYKRRLFRYTFKYPSSFIH